jgi:Tfp pilus assembly protein PilF
MPSTGFISDFLRFNNQMENCPFAWILGAGASKSSGIPTGLELVDKWLLEIQQRSFVPTPVPPMDSWATEETLSLGRPGFTYEDRASFYPDVFDRLFGDHPELGYADIEHIMKDKEPSVGYSVLAQILENTKHKVVITTNFDNLVADALSIHTKTFPLVCGHESLAGFVTPQLRRPLIAKIHRDFLLAPQNDREGTRKLHENWERVLKRVLEIYTPVVIGYGGNDGSLMDFLASRPDGSLRYGIYWCYRNESEIDKPLIQSLIAKQKGKFVQIVGFDEIMVQIGSELGYDLQQQGNVILERAKERADRYKETLTGLIKRITESDTVGQRDEVAKPVRSAILRMPRIEKSKKEWWRWALEAQNEKDHESAIAIYRRGLRQNPEDVVLLNNFANFLRGTMKKYDEAEQLYKKGLEVDPNDPDLLMNYATFLFEAGKHYDEADKLFKEALKVDPINPILLMNYANFLTKIRKSHDEAEKLYQQALSIDPNKPNLLGNYALFLTDIRKNHDEAERLYNLAVTADPNNANLLGNYAVFLTDIRKNHDEAERSYNLALAVDPNNPNLLGSYATFLTDIRKNHDEAERLYKQAQAVDPNNPNLLGNYANFLTIIRKNHHEAEKLCRRALEVNVTAANTHANFASLLVGLKRVEEARVELKAAIACGSGEPGQVVAEICFYQALVLRSIGTDDSNPLGRIKSLLDQGFTRLNWSFDNLFESAAAWLGEEELPFYKAISEAILDESKVANLMSFDRWKSLEPIPFDAPWPEW